MYVCACVWISGVGGWVSVMFGMGYVDGRRGLLGGPSTTDLPHPTIQNTKRQNNQNPLRRSTMEDVHRLIPCFDGDHGTSFVGIYDGHGGAFVFGFCFCGRGGCLLLWWGLYVCVPALAKIVDMTHQNHRSLILHHTRPPHALIPGRDIVDFLATELERNIAQELKVSWWCAHPSTACLWVNGWMCLGVLLALLLSWLVAPPLRVMVSID